MNYSKIRILGWLSLGGLLVSACTPSSTPAPTTLSTNTSALEQSATLAASATHAPSATPEETFPPPTVSVDETEKPAPPANNNLLAEVASVSVSGEADTYTFSVKVSSPDEGCSQYADWWEVISPEGELIYRRILLHSHVGEQPFTRSGGPVPIEADEIVIVRAHMNPGGYGGSALQGSASNGFSPVELTDNAFSEVAQQPPLPAGCNF